MIERSYLNLVNSLIEGQDRFKIAKYIDSLSCICVTSVSPSSRYFEYWELGDDAATIPFTV